MSSGNLAGAVGGGAVYAEMNSNATFTNCLVINNTQFSPAKVCRGSIRSCTLPVSPVVFTRVSAFLQGGGFKMVSGSSLRLTNVTIVGNAAFFAGGIHAEVRATAAK